MQLLRCPALLPPIDGRGIVEDPYSNHAETSLAVARNESRTVQSLLKQRLASLATHDPLEMAHSQFVGVVETDGERTRLMAVTSVCRAVRLKHETVGIDQRLNAV